ncbi:hypothetical protein MRB53_041035 [Persea americana]|nr:hypothetical protein MRB53_041035 [Persea americana]
MVVTGAHSKGFNIIESADKLPGHFHLAWLLWVGCRRADGGLAEPAEIQASCGDEQGHEGRAMTYFSLARVWSQFNAMRAGVDHNSQRIPLAAKDAPEARDFPAQIPRTPKSHLEVAGSIIVAFNADSKDLPYTIALRFTSEWRVRKNKR